MDDKAAQRISKARGKSDPFSKRADMAARNNKDRTGGSADVSWRKGDADQDKDKTGPPAKR
ncbi:hypothetical protein F4779DRAFT_614613 [Xylariaceae sp. FL0662B]|nr:hypothetical protein F4779DRAFT_614613 [Xylariaceae sp. FL0662B]